MSALLSSDTVYACGDGLGHQSSLSASHQLASDTGCDDGLGHQSYLSASRQLASDTGCDDGLSHQSTVLESTPQLMGTSHTDVPLHAVTDVSDTDCVLSQLKQLPADALLYVQNGFLQQLMELGLNMHLHWL